MKPLLKASRGAAPIGLDIAGRWIKAAQVGPGRHNDRPRLLAAARLSRRDTSNVAAFSPADADLVAGVLDRAGFRGRQVVLVAPRDLLYTEVLELPPRSSGAPLEQLARMELARCNRCDPDSFELGHWDLPALGRSGAARAGESDTTQVFAVGLAHNRAETIIDALHGAGLEVVAIDTPGCSLARACRAHAAGGAPAGQSGELAAILDIGWNSALLVVVCAQSGGSVIYERSIVESGLSSIFQAIRTRLGVEENVVDLVFAGGHQGSSGHPIMTEARGSITDYLETLVPEVQRSISYTTHRYQGWSMSRLLVTGDGAGLAGVTERLSAAMSCPVASAAPGELFELPPKGLQLQDSSAGAPASLLTAAGASLHAAVFDARGRDAA
jgi:Tfp pilus assembly PilM family ATPase